jgi:hypothetical protein
MAQKPLTPSVTSTQVSLKYHIFRGCVPYVGNQNTGWQELTKVRAPKLWKKSFMTCP